MESNDIYSIDDKSFNALLDYCSKRGVLLLNHEYSNNDFFSRFSQEFWNLHSYINWVYYAITFYLEEHRLSSLEAEISVDDFCESHLLTEDSFDYDSILYNIYNNGSCGGLENYVLKFITDCMNDERFKAIIDDYYSKAAITVKIKRPFSDITTDIKSFWDYKKTITRNIFGDNSKYPYFFFPEISAFAIDLMLDDNNMLYFAIPWCRNFCANNYYCEAFKGIDSSMDISNVSLDTDIAVLAGFIELKIKQWIEPYHTYILIKTYEVNGKCYVSSIIEKAIGLITLEKNIVYATIQYPSIAHNVNF